MDALAVAADRCVPSVWCLATTGFTTTVDEIPTYVRGCLNDDEAVGVTELVVSTALSPAQRAALTSLDGLLPAVLSEAKRQLLARAERTGRAVSLANEHEAVQVPEGTPDIDEILERKLELSAPPAHHFRRPEDPKLIEVCAAAVAELDERSRRLVDLRWRKGKTAQQVAEEFTCGAAAVIAHERRVRQRVKRALFAHYPDDRFGRAEQDRLLAQTSGQPSLPLITRERLRADILKRTFQDEPAPYRVRLGWGLGAAGVALGLWLMMFFDVLPHPDDDVFLPPSVAVRCLERCSVASPAQIDVLAPVDTRFVAVMVAGPDGRVQPLLTAPGGGVIRLPLGARGHEVPLPYPARWPAGVRGRSVVTAIFSEVRISPAVLRDVAAGNRGGVPTSTTTVMLTP